MSPAALSRTHVVLVRPQGPINVGLACRAAANMGAASVRVVAPGPLALRPDLARPFACHATDLLQAIVPYPNLTAALEDTDYALATSRRVRRGPQTFVEEKAAGAALMACPRASAIVFGSEADGLSTEELQLCDATLALELPGAYPSLNLSHAVAIVLWILQQHLPRLAHPNTRPAATGTQRRALFTLWQAALEDTGYFLRIGRGPFLAKLRAMTQGLGVTGPDVQILAGMLRHWQRLGSRQDAAPGSATHPTPAGTGRPAACADTAATGSATDRAEVSCATPTPAAPQL